MTGSGELGFHCLHLVNVTVGAGEQGFYYLGITKADCEDDEKNTRTRDACAG